MSLLSHILENYLNLNIFQSKEVLHDYLKKYPGSIQVDIYPYPFLILAVSILGEKYVKSAPNEYGTDNLLCLPRE